ncbi:MAG: hypothetical protein A2096_00740 [Spirochaetes bacterium GWF1_41_5]|nr:MAG: hypothetical protein A2096_00740 [Spirochaetes bacterium GWF1_41_5]
MAGVSFKTVSRVINNEAHVSEQAAEKVKKAVDTLGFRLNASARSLKTRQTKTIGILAQNLHIEVLSKKTEALQNSFFKAGYKTLIGFTHNDYYLACDYINSFSAGADALVYLSQSFAEYKLPVFPGPCLAVDCVIDKIPSLKVDRQSGVRQALSSLYLCYKKFCLITTSKKSDDREKAYMSFIKKKALAGRSKILRFFCDPFTAGKSAVEKNPPAGKTLYICYNDKIASGVLKALYNLKTAVPEQAGVIGFDDDEYGRYGNISLSTISQSVEEIAAKACDYIVSRLKGEEKKIFPVNTFFIPREST